MAKEGIEGGAAGEGDDSPTLRRFTEPSGEGGGDAIEGAGKREAETDSG